MHPSSSFKPKTEIPVLSPEWTFYCHFSWNFGFFATPQPGELGIEDGNGLGGGFPGNWPGRGGWKWCRHQSAASSLVASVGLAAAGSQAAQLLRRLIKKDVWV